MFIAGSETTAAAMSVFLLAMALHPDVMREAQTELDGVIGRDRLPTFEDFDRLPYIRAVVKEVLRWRVVTPLGVPRCTAESDWYEGYYIPKGSLVIANAWGMHRDPEVFLDPDEFRPSRFLDASGKLSHELPDNIPLGHAAFGFGRRICSGLNLANQTLFINIACILWALDIEKAVDDHGNPMTLSNAKFVDQGVTTFRRPAPFTCSIKPRSDDVVAVLEQAKADK